MHVRRSSRSTFNIEQVSIPVQSTSAFPCAGQHSDTDHTSSASMLLPPITLLGKHQAGQHLISNRLAFFVEYVSISLCRSAFDHTSSTANYPPRKSSSRSAFNVEQVSISYPMIEQVSIRRLRNFCPSSHRSAFDI
jgi:hypothetical protein